MTRILLNLLAIGAVGSTALSFTTPAKAQQYTVNQQTTNKTNWYGLGIGALLIGGISAYSTWLIFDTRYQRLKNSVDDKIRDADLERNEAVRTTKATTETVRKLHEQLNEYKISVDELANKLNAEITAKLILTNNNQQILDKANSEIDRLKLELQFVGKTKNELDSKVKQLEADVEVLHDEFDKNLQLKFDEELEVCVERETDYLCGLTEKAFALMKEFDDWYQVIRKHHEEQRETALNLGDEYVSNLNRIIATADNSAAAHQEALNEAHAEIQRLRAKEQGVLLEPLYIDSGVGKASIIANEFIRYIWNTHKLPLKLQGYEQKEDTTVVAGYGYSSKLDVDGFLRFLNGNKEKIAKDLLIHKIDFSLLTVSPTITATIVIDRPPAIKDEEIYRKHNLEKAENFGSIIRKYHNHKSNGKPTLRVMGGTGGGKSLATKVIIKSYVDHEDGWEIRLSDPQDGSPQDYWDIPKVAIDGSTAHKAFKEFVTEFDARKSGTSSHKNQKLLGVFDEFDKEHSDDDKEAAKRIWTAIRHQEMRLILMGQSSQVGVNGWHWDDMRNCTLLFIGDAIITAVGNYKELGFDLKTKNKIDRDYRTISEWMITKNDELELPPENNYRIALLVCGTFYKFLEIPKAVIGGIDNGRSWIVSKPWQISTNTQSSVFSNSLDDSQKELKTKNVEVKVECPKCGSEDIIKNGKDRKTKTVQEYKCKDCGHNFDDNDLIN